MPYYETERDYQQRIAERKKRLQEKKRKHTEVVNAYKAGKLTWNEYIRLEKKYRI